MSSIYYYEPFFSFSDFDRLINRTLGQASTTTAQNTQGSQNGNENDRQLSLGGFQPK